MCAKRVNSHRVALGQDPRGQSKTLWTTRSDEPEGELAMLGFPQLWNYWKAKLFKGFEIREARAPDRVGHSKHIIKEQLLPQLDIMALCGFGSSESHQCHTGLIPTINAFLDGLKTSNEREHPTADLMGYPMAWLGVALYLLMSCHTYNGKQISQMSGQSMKSY